MGDEGVQLDAEAQSLFEQFGGMETWKKSPRTGGGSDRLAESLLAEQKRLDTVRILLMRMAYLISRYLKDDTFAGGDHEETKVFESLSGVMDQLADVSGHLGCAFIRFRGAPADPDLPDKYDYELVIGNTVVDSLMAPRVARRNGPKMSAMPEWLLDAFTVFADYGVNNLYLEIPDNLKSHLPSIQFCLKMLSGFRTARQSGAAMMVDTGKTSKRVPVINDENMFPDPNLTLLAGLNGVSPKSMAGLVEKVDQWLRKQEQQSDAGKYAGVYNAAMELPKIRAQMVKPPVEMNNVRWLITDNKDEELTLEKAYIAQLAFETAGQAPQKVAKMIKSVYGDDYATISKSILGERLNLSSDLLTAAEKGAKKAQVRKEVLGNLHQRLDQVKDHVIDEVDVRQAAGESDSGNAGAHGAVHSQVYNMVKFYKGRSSTRKKMVGMVHRPIAFTERDYAILAKDFRISSQDAAALVDKLKGCFGQGGRFKKRGFQDALIHFMRYEQKIFGFLWHHMKDAIMPEDRIAFLNALQGLTSRMKQPKRAFKTLLEDICRDPEKLQFSDNKAVMLVNLIVHRPDKSLADYEITPEDIVLNRHNLDPMVVKYAAWRIDKEQEQFFTKVKTVHNKLVEGLCIGETSKKQIPASVLLNLERELYIFLSMVVCDTGKAILRSAVNEYGNPQSEIYHQKESGNFLSGLMQILRVSLRGLGTVGGMQDVSLLEGIKAHNEDFQRLKNDRQFRAQARLVSEWADEAIKIIKFNA